MKFTQLRQCVNNYRWRDQEDQNGRRWWNVAGWVVKDDGVSFWLLCFPGEIGKELLSRRSTQNHHRGAWREVYPGPLRRWWSIQQKCIHVFKKMHELECSLQHYWLQVHTGSSQDAHEWWRGSQQNTVWQWSGRIATTHSDTGKHHKPDSESKKTNTNMYPRVILVIWSPKPGRGTLGCHRSGFGFP